VQQSSVCYSAWLPVVDKMDSSGRERIGQQGPKTVMAGLGCRRQQFFQNFS